jgi:hypothetical protein
MPAPPQGLAFARTVWLIFAPPLAGFAWQLARGLRGAGETRDPWPRRVGFGTILLAAAAVAGHAARLARVPDGVSAFVQQPLHPGGTLLQGTFGLIFDRTAGTACGLACATAIAAAWLGPGPGWRPWAWLQLSLAGALLAFLADGPATTLLGWVPTAASAAWLAGWSEPRAGAVRATRSGLAVVALLLGTTMLGPAPGPTWSRLALGAASELPMPSFVTLGALLVAAIAMSATLPSPGAPLVLAAVACGGTVGLVGPFLALRLAPLAGEGGSEVLAAGALALLAVTWAALDRADGPSRVLAAVAAAPVGLTCIALGADGPAGGLLVFVAAGLAAGFVLFGAAARGFAPEGQRSDSTKPESKLATAGPDLERVVFEVAPSGAGALLGAFERWVVDAIAGAVVVLVSALSWTIARLDAGVVGAPANALAARTVRASRALEPLVGGSLARVAWVLIAVLLAAALVHAVGSGR